MKITGLSIQDILDMDWKEINKLSLEEMKKLSMRLNSAANKRLRRVEASGEERWSPAYQAVQQSGGDFSVKGKTTKAEIKAELQRAGSFLTAKTSSVRGTKAHKQKIEKLVKEPADQNKTKLSASTYGKMVSDAQEDLSERSRKTLFNTLDRLRETNAALVHNIGSDIIIKEIRKAQQQKGNRNRFQLAKEIERRFPELAEDSEARYVREEQERQERTDQDGVFRALEADELSDNPFKS